MPTSRAIVVLGMHRNGTSVLTRALKTLGVFIGDNFLETRPDNPTGYWEDKTIVDKRTRPQGLRPWMGKHCAHKGRPMAGACLELFAF
jgi:hypothetical protein